MTARAAARVSAGRALAGAGVPGAVGPGRGAPTTSAAAPDLRELLGDRLLRPADADYPAATRVWNGAVDRAPALVARCRDADEVAGGG
ncbi:hypothetical protein [Micromonospora purpureochromogenes]|uniref:Uncharacterized protein n=1 Tax=Micromonospora purpureochromogenes TaxID=47872 RepID=A0ABX2RCW0_9ACTN|nr:hypothetical protein [Micromonospora purpureochromogenes]NYF54181.1 hypothetical protein [Micromonospora purpureochromogenes]